MNNTVTQRTDCINGMEVTPSTLSTVVQTGGGRFVKLTGGTWEPQYCYTDHRGDIRVVYHANATTGTAEVVQEDHLTPFGVQMVGMGRTNWPENQYRYQGKELNTTGFDTNGDNITDLRLYQYDFGARQYDPLIGRWHSADPENQYSSPYVAMGNNWISTIDPDGKWAIFRWISNFLSGISWSGSNDYEDTYYYEGFGWARAEGLAYCGFTPGEIAQKMETGNGNNGTSGSMSGSGGGGGGGGRTSSDKNKKKADGKGSGGSEKQKSSGDGDKGLLKGGLYGLSIDLTIGTLYAINQWSIPLGYTIEVGVVFDGMSAGIFVSDGPAIGAEASLGVNAIVAGSRNTELTIDNYRGNSASVSLNIGAFSTAIIDDVRNRALVDHHFQTYGGLKVGVGFGIGGSFQFTETRIIGRATTIGWFPFMSFIY